jgi:antirestriction protein ArdC
LALLCRLGLTRQPREEHDAYIANWLDALTADNHAIVTAASHAPRAADFVNSLQPAASRPYLPPAASGRCICPIDIL